MWKIRKYSSLRLVANWIPKPPGKWNGREVFLWSVEIPKIKVYESPIWWYTARSFPYACGGRHCKVNTTSMRHLDHQYFRILLWMISFSSCLILVCLAGLTAELHFFNFLSTFLKGFLYKFHLRRVEPGEKLFTYALGSIILSKNMEYIFVSQHVLYIQLTFQSEQKMRKATLLFYMNDFYPP